MRVRRIIVTIEAVEECRKTCGTVYRPRTVTLDVTKEVLSLALDDIRKLGDTNAASLKFARPFIAGEIGEVTILQSILDHFGVDRLKEITSADLHNSRLLTGMVRQRVRSVPTQAMKKAA